MFVDLPGFVSEQGKVRCVECVVKIAIRRKTTLVEMLEEEVVLEDWEVGLTKCEKCKNTFRNDVEIEYVVELPAVVTQQGKVLCGECVEGIAVKQGKLMSEVINEGMVEVDNETRYEKCEKCERRFIE